MKRDIKEIICRISISMSAILAIFPLVAGIVPGSLFWFYIIAALLAIPGVFVKKLTSKIFALFMLAFCIFFAVAAHNRGIEYKKWLSNQPPLKKEIKELEGKLKEKSQSQ